MQKKSKKEFGKQEFSLRILKLLPITIELKFINHKVI